MAYIDTGSTAGAGSAGSSGGGWSSFLSSNSFGSLLGAGGGLLAGLLGGNASVPYAGNITNVANVAGQESTALSTEGQALVNPLITGQLPAGADAQVQQYIDQQTAATRARYAQLGQTGSTMETDALNNIQTGAASLKFQIAQQMAQTGLQASSQSLTALNITNSAYSELMQAQMKADSGLSSSIGGFASAIGSALPGLIKALPSL